MSVPQRGYFESLAAEWGTGWNRFWFTPADPARVAWLRCLTGFCACWFFLSFSFDLTDWYGRDGLLPGEMVQQLTERDGPGWNGRASLLNVSEDRGFLVAVHVASLLVSVGFTIGLATPIMGPLTLLFLLSYIHRGPLLMGAFESVLTFMLLYLCLTPCGHRLSVDRWWRMRYLPAGGARGEVAPSVAANVGQRLMQVHVAALYATISLTKLGGDVWWNGEALWWLVAHPESRLVDLTFLHRHGFLFDIGTHSVVLFELLFGVLIWNRLARPILLAIAVIYWPAMGLITGQLSYSAIMVIASLSFLPPIRSVES